MLGAFFVEVLKAGVTALVTSFAGGVGGHLADAFKPQPANTPAAAAVVSSLDKLETGGSVYDHIAETQRAMAALLHEQPSYGVQVASAIRQFSPENYSAELDAAIARMQQQAAELRSFKLPSAAPAADPPSWFTPSPQPRPDSPSTDLSKWIYHPPVFESPPPESAAPAISLDSNTDSRLTIPASSAPDLDATLKKLRDMSEYETIDDFLARKGMKPLGS